MEKVTTVSEFVRVIESAPDLEWFRGESVDYGKTRLMASGIRSDGKLFSLIDLRCQELYDRTFSKISRNEYDHFLAFAQHHGIPTNLLDITSNALVALWFSCSSNYGSDGIVYGFGGNLANLTEYIEITERPHNSSLLADDTVSENREKHFKQGIVFSQAEFGLSKAFFALMSILSREDCNALKGAIKEIINQMPSFDMATIDMVEIPGMNFRHEPFDSCLEDLLKAFDDIDFSECDNNETASVELSEQLAQATISSFVKPYAKSFTNYDENYNVVKKEENVIKQVCAYLLGIVLPFHDVLVPCMPRILYTPRISFERAVKQQGAFFYQWYGIDDYQTIEYDFSIAIDSSHKKNILNELHRLGFNQASLYGDYDNIAQFIVTRTKNSGETDR